MTATCTLYKTDGTIDTVESIPTKVVGGDRVVFVDNSYLDNCINNLIPHRSNCYPAGLGRHNSRSPLSGTVLHTDSSIQAIDSEFPSAKGIVTIITDLPVVVLADDDSIIYCNQHNIRKI